MSRFEQQIFEYFSMFQRQMLAQPLLLGGAPGSGGGYGGRPGGFTGYLPQIRVAYDISELATLTTPSSGQSLLDNLNHIRARIQTLETTSGISGIQVQMNDILVANGVTIVNFEGDATVVNNGGGKVTVAISGGADSTIRGLRLRIPNTIDITYGTDTYVEWEEVTDEDNYFSIADNTKVNFNRDGWYLTTLNLGISPPYDPPTEDSRYEVYLEFNSNNWNRAYYFPVTSGVLVDSFSMSFNSLDYIVSGEYLKVDIYNGFQNGSSTVSKLIRGLDYPVTTSSLTVVRFA